MGVVIAWDTSHAQSRNVGKVGVEYLHTMIAGIGNIEITVSMRLVRLVETAYLKSLIAGVRTNLQHAIRYAPR